MKTFMQNGFVIIVVLAFLAVILLIAWAVVNIGCGEIIQTRLRNDLVAAHYVATAGAEKVYATLRSQSTVIWGQPMTGSLTLPNGVAGAFTATAQTLSAEEFCIVSDGVVNGRKARAVVKYGFVSNFTGGAPLASIGQMSLTGATNPAKLKIEGPAMSNQPSITVEGAVTVTEGTYPNAALLVPTFWCDADQNPKITFDTNNDLDFAVDIDGDGVVTRNEAITQGKEAAFNADNSYAVDNGDADELKNDYNRISDHDAFYRYYTVDLNEKYGLEIGPGQSNYYTGDQAFDEGDVATSVKVIFVDGNVAIDKNDQEWQGNATLGHTVAAMGSVDIFQPTNRPGDVLTVVAFRNVTVSGTMGNQGGTIGDLIVYANGNFTAEHGGKANASIVAKGDLIIDTIGDNQGKDHRMLNKSTLDWSDESKRPIGLPKDYAMASFAFSVKNESTYKSVWQRS